MPTNTSAPLAMVLNGLMIIFIVSTVNIFIQLQHHSVTIRPLASTAEDAEERRDVDLLLKWVDRHFTEPRWYNGFSCQ